MSKTISTKILVRRDTANNWMNNNPVLAQGEIGFDTTTGKHKIGDGISNWRSLPYFVLDSDIDVNKTLYGILEEDGTITYVSAGGSGFSTTGNVSDLNNDLNFQTKEQVEALIKKALASYGVTIADTEPTTNKTRVWITLED